MNSGADEEIVRALTVLNLFIINHIKLLKFALRYGIIFRSKYKGFEI